MFLVVATFHSTARLVRCLHFSVEFKSSFDKKLRADEIIEWEKLILIDMFAYCVNVNVPEGFIPILVHVSFQFLHASLKNLDRKHGVVIS